MRVRKLAACPNRCDCEECGRLDKNIFARAFIDGDGDILVASGGIWYQAQAPKYGFGLVAV